FQSLSDSENPLLPRSPASLLLPLKERDREKFILQAKNSRPLLLKRVAWGSCVAARRTTIRSSTCWGCSSPSSSRCCC
ncbi:Os01g0936600, partial [Oryza sativa Japonica Group]